MEVKIKDKFILLNRPVEIMAVDTGFGINVLICGGDLPHIGAVAAAAPGSSAKVISFPGHREDVVCKRWAEAISNDLKVAASVSAGIHFDNINKEDIQFILDTMEKKLSEILQVFSKNTLQIEDETL